MRKTELRRFVIHELQTTKVWPPAATRITDHGNCVNVEAYLKRDGSDDDGRKKVCTLHTSMNEYAVRRKLNAFFKDNAPFKAWIMGEAK